MKKVGNHKSFSKIFFSLAFVLVTSLSAFSQDAAKGKELFNTNCAACHKLDGKATGPALRDVAAKYDKEWLYKWIKNSGELIKSGDAQAVKVFNENNKVPMTAFPQLSNEDVDNILAYTSEPAPAAPAVVPGAPVAGEANADSGVSNNVILGVLSLVMIMLVVMLFLVNNMLTKIADAKGLEVAQKDRSVMNIFKAYAKNQFLVLVSAILLLLVSAYFAYGWMMQIGVDQGYEPVQPIHYSHRIHAGENGIDCKYCHSAARVGKHSNIPSLNVCMNCHKNISEVAETTATEEHSKAFYDEQIAKLYDAVGWDKSLQKYTGKTKPVKWVRIHNLPDHVYFNHSQHVTVAGVECQTCHGPVEEMEIMKQHAPLTMGWCINCHRETNVKVEDNAYYKKIHEELSKKYGVSQLTAAQMGGLECGKCHY
ncbi:c-type cytochrome [Flavobacterium sp. LMO8]|uniref:c-type cytochrome n=1 Tax=Flavobacterium sp. LMO8 TaxID=2654244 RepID=UPI0012926302|nr:c-type cytochrome [Flavobacterium sp. LMO8]MQP25309.1 c-type cytochrome [Flavobacterium sp. LMO8]